MYLVAVLPPSNIRRIVCDYQISLFRRGAEPAALALPPHIALAFFDSPPPRPGGLVQLTPLATSAFVEDPPWLLLEFQPREELERIRYYLPEMSLPGWYPTGRGILIAVNRGKAALAESECPVIGWRTSHLVCLELKVENPVRWWEHIEYTEIWRVKLKRHIE
jgi:hypothetical protein